MNRPLVAAAIFLFGYGSANFVRWDLYKTRVFADLRGMAAAIENFRHHNGRFPTKAEFADLPLIQTLTPSGNGEITPGGTPLGTMRDTFDQTYFYSRFSDADGYILRSHGRDGEPSEDDYVWHSLQRR